MGFLAKIEEVVDFGPAHQKLTFTVVKSFFDVFELDVSRKSVPFRKGA